MFKKLSVLIPVYNEEKTIKTCIDRVLSANTLNMDLEVIVSDNNSTDGTKEILKSIKDSRVKLLFKEKNEGKGSNIKNALNHATGDIILFQDADLEYSPDNDVLASETTLNSNDIRLTIKQDAESKGTHRIMVFINYT